MENKLTLFDNSIQTTGYLIGHIHWLNKIRKETKEPDIIMSINISITILLCTYVESVLNELLFTIIEKRKEETDDTSYQRLLQNTQVKLAKASWLQYIDICKVILPKSLNCYTDNEIWKGITILFSLRNIIVHGKKVKSKIFFKENKLGIEYADVFEKVLNYFKEQKVLKSSNHKILSTQSTIHFIKITDKFINEIFRKICEEQNLDRRFMSVTLKDNYILRHGIDPAEIEPKSKRTQKKGDDDLPF